MPNRLRGRIPTLVRFFLALVFCVYGSVKLAGGQFYHGDFTYDSKVDDAAPSGLVSLVWAFYGRSYVYSSFIGLGELVPALLLLFPRSALLGACMLFPIALNITVMDFCYGYPSVRWMALGYTCMLTWLIWLERRRLLQAFWTGNGADISTEKSL